MLEKSDATRDGDEKWSVDAEVFNYDSLEELLGAEGHLQAGDVVYRGVASRPAPANLARRSAGIVIEHIGELAYEEFGELADEYPRVNDEAEAELQGLIEQWATKHCPIEFFVINQPIPYILSAWEIEKAQGV